MFRSTARGGRGQVGEAELTAIRVASYFLCQARKSIAAVEARPERVDRARADVAVDDAEGGQRER